MIYNKLCNILALETRSLICERNGKKMFKRFFTFLLAIVMCFSVGSTALAVEPETSNLTVSATDDDWNLVEVSNPENGIELYTIGGTETWYEGGDFSDHFTFYGNNLTPVKTIGTTGNMNLYVFFNNGNTPVKLEVQIRKAGTSENIAKWTLGPTAYYEHTLPTISVTKGQKIQIYFRVLDQNGNYNTNRPLTMLYGYFLTT